MNIKLRIENTLVDVSSENITLQNNSNLLGAIDKIQTSRSFTIVCPFTLTNEAVFGHLELPSITNDFLTDYKVATLEVEGVFIFTGKAVLLSIGTDGYEIALTFGELNALYTLITDKRKISELGLDEIYTQWDYNTASPATADNYGIYPYGYGQTFQGGVVQRSASVAVSYLLEVIADFYGLELTNPSDLFYLILTKNINNSLKKAALNPYLLVVWNPPNPPDRFYWSNYAGDDWEKMRRGANALGGAFGFPHTYSFSVADKSKMKGLRFTSIDTLGSILVTYNDGASQFYLTPSDPVKYVLENAINEGGEIVVSTFSTFVVLVKVEYDLLDDADYPILYNLPLPHEYENIYCNFPVIANCDFTALELIKNYQIFRGLYATQGETETSIVFKEFNDIADITNKQDMTDRFISLEKSEFTFGDWAKTNYFKYASSDTEITEDYNRSEFLLTYYQLQEENTTQATFGTGTNDTPMRINQFASGYTLNSLPIIFARLSSLQLISYPFSDILTDSYQPLITVLENLRVCTINLRLSQLQYKAFDMNEPIYLKQLGKYFYPITGDYDVSSGIFKLKALLLTI